MKHEIPIELVTGFPVIDQQHAELLERAEQLMNALAERKDTATALRIHSYLTDYSTRHFALEEEVMVRFDYPERVAHLASHMVFTNRLRQIEDEIGAWGTGFGLMSEAVLLLPDFLIRHVSEHDLELARFLREQDSKEDPFQVVT